jgi:hypothetical protein
VVGAPECANVPLARFAKYLKFSGRGYGPKRAFIGGNMKLMKKLVWMVPTAALCWMQPSDADACGGCFVPPEENTQVTGHRMLLSVGMAQTTLYDQIEYTGDPSEFAWVLPIKGQATLGVSSDPPSD